jgi:hypothetical protein
MIDYSKTKTTQQARTWKLPQCTFVFHKRIVAALDLDRMLNGVFRSFTRSANKFSSPFEERENIPLLVLQNLLITSVPARTTIFGTEWKGLVNDQKAWPASSRAQAIVGK